MISNLVITFTLLTAVSAQQIGTQKAETHPSLTTQKCTATGCTSQDSSIVLDANFRLVHSVDSNTNCYTGNTWNTDICSDAATCAAKCAVDGADYAGTYGITTSGDALTLSFIKGSNVGSRVYLLANDSSYEVFKLEDAEVTFNVDVSTLPCGINGALYFAQMDADGGMTKYAGNKAGAGYGTGYCDAQCPRDLKFINGEANIVNPTPSTSSTNSTADLYGSCCAEMDIWEANSISSAYTPHVCSVTEQTRCETDVACGVGAANHDSSLCDKSGCDFNSFRMGNESFYGPGKTVDTSSVFTVVTQFIGSPLTEIRRMYIQDGTLISNSNTDVTGVTVGNSITDNFCTEQKTVFGNNDTFSAMGGLSTMGTALSSGMVLAMSIWDDYSTYMLWLDSNYPANASTATPGVARGTCDAASGVPATVESAHSNATVIYSNIKWGTLNSTYNITGAGTSTTV